MRSPGMAFRCVLLLTLSLAWPTTAPAQEPNQTDADEMAKDATAWERLIYLPYKNLRDVFDKHGASVFVPYQEYLKLWERSAGGMRPHAEGPPVTAVISESHYKARVDGDLARIEAVLQIQVLDKPWAEVPLNFGDAAVGKITSPNDQVLLRGTGPGTYALLLPEKGEHSVTLELVSRVHTSPDGRSFDLKCPPVGITTFEISVPEGEQTVEVTPRLVALPVDAGDDETRVKAGLGSTPQIAVRWHPKAGLKPEMDLLTAVNNLLHVSVGDGLVHTDATLQYEILRGVLDEVRIAVPTDHRVLDVSTPGARIGGWQTVAEENRQLLIVKLLSSVEKQLTVEVHTERPLPDEAFDAAGIGDDDVVHGIHAVGAVRESGQLVLSHSADLTLAVERQQGLIRIDAAGVPETLRSPSSLYYKFYNPRLTLRALARPVEPRLLVDQQTQLVFRDDEIRLQSTLAYQIERAGVFMLTLNLPDELAVDTVTADGMQEFNVDRAAGTLTIALTEKRQGALTVSVTGHRPLDAAAADAEQTLPLLEPVAVSRETGRVFVYAPPAIEVITDEQGVTGAFADPNASAPAVAGARFVAAWIYNRRPVEITVRTVRRPTRLTATLGTTVHLEEQLAEVATLLRYTVEYAGLDTFRFEVPEVVADKVQISTAGGGTIRQKTRAPEAQDGWVTWTVVMQQDVMGQQSFRVTYDLDYAAPAEGEAANADANPPDLVFRPLRALPPFADAADQQVELSSLKGEIVVTKNRALSVGVPETEGELETIDVRELELLPQAGDVAFRYFKQPVEVSLTKTKHEIQEVVETVVSRALVEVVLARDDTATYRCRYVLKSSQRQRLRVDLPAGVDVLGVMVDRTLVAPEKNTDAGPIEGWDSYYVNVARSKTSDEPFWLTILFRAGSSAMSSNGGELSFQLPQIGDTAQRSVVVQQLRTAVWVPDEFALVGTPDRFDRELPTYLAGLIGPDMVQFRQTRELENWIGVPVAGMFEFPTEGHVYQYSSLGSAASLSVVWWRTDFLAWVLSGTVLAIGLVLLKTTWQNRLTVLLVVGLLAVLFAVKDEDWVLHLLAAARPGLIAVLAIWLVHALTRARTWEHGTSAPNVAGGATAGAASAAVVPPPGTFDEFE